MCKHHILLYRHHILLHRHHILFHRHHKCCICSICSIWLAWLGGGMEPVIWRAMVRVLGAGTNYNVNKILIS